MKRSNRLIYLFDLLVQQGIIGKIACFKCVFGRPIYKKMGRGHIRSFFENVAEKSKVIRMSGLVLVGIWKSGTNPEFQKQQCY
jgi:hypothetical protein